MPSAGPVGTKFFSDFSVTKNANSNLIAVLDCKNMFLLTREISSVSNKNYGRGTQNKLSNQTRVLTFLSSAGPVGTKFFSDFSETKNANSNLIAVLSCRNILLLICELTLASNKKYGRGTQN